MTRAINYRQLPQPLVRTTLISVLFRINIMRGCALCVRTRRGLSRPTASKSPASFPAKPYNYIICIFDRIIGFSGEFRFSRPDKVLHRLLDIASQLGDRTPSSFWLHHTELRTKPFTARRRLHLWLHLMTHFANGLSKSNWIFTG